MFRTKEGKATQVMGMVKRQEAKWGRGERKKVDHKL
jgi:hypothetical protein